jgi:hypothetical protein
LPEMRSTQVDPERIGKGMDPPVRRWTLSFQGIYQQEDQIVKKIRKAKLFLFSGNEAIEATVMERGFQSLQADLQDAA